MNNEILINREDEEFMKSFRIRIEIGIVDKY